MIEAAFRQHVESAAGVPCYPLEAPERARPAGSNPEYCIARRISGVHDRHLRGATGLTQVRMQLDIIGAIPSRPGDYGRVKQIAEAVRLKTDGRFNFTMGANDDATNIRTAILDNDADIYEPPIDGSERGLRGVRQDWIIWHNQPAPSITQT